MVPDPVVAGAALAVLSLARVVEDLLRDHPVRTAAVFFGLIAGSVWVAWRIIREPGVVHGVVAGLVGIVSFVLFGLRSSVIADPGWYVFVGAGALAICAFILPGVSGSFMLLAIGMYQHVLAIVNDARLGHLAAFAIGAAVGLGLFSRVLHRLLDRHHDLVVAAMIGLMLGSFRILWPWPAGLGDETGAAPPSWDRPARTWPRRWDWPPPLRSWWWLSAPGSTAGPADSQASVGMLSRERPPRSTPWLYAMASEG